MTPFTRILAVAVLVAGAATLAAAADDDVILPANLQSQLPKKYASPATAPKGAAAADASKDSPKPVCGGAVPFLPTGFRFPALLPDAIFSYNAVAPTTALIEEDIKYLDRVVIPKKSYLVGNVGAVHTDDRVNINWLLLVTPQGCEIPFSGIALEASDGAAGVKGKLTTHKDSLAAQLLIKSALTGASAATALTGGIAAPVENSVVGNFSTQAGTMVDQNMSKIQSLDSVDVPERTPIRVFVLHRYAQDGK